MNSNLMATQKFFGAWLLASLLASVTLTGCGGGGSSSASTENTLPSPVAGGINGEVLVPSPNGENPAAPTTLELLPKVSVGERQFADPNVLLNLSGTVTAAKGATIVKTLWTQVTGPEVIIPSPQALDNVVLVPDVSITTQLEFRLTAQDSEDRINSATVSILVKPVPTFVKVIGGVFNEAKGPAVFTVRLNAPSTVPVTISYVSQDGTATSATDYFATSGEIVLAAGEVTKEISVPLINDAIDEGDETFSLQVTAIDGTATHANTGVAIIRNGVEPQLQQTLQFTDKGPVAIFTGEQYTNVLSPAAPGTGDIIYSSSDSSIASVTAQGVVTAVAVGTATITATKVADDIYQSATASYTLQVNQPGPSIAQTIQFAGPKTISPGQTYGHVLNPAPPGSGEIIYSSSNSSVASVTTDGIVTAIAVGTTTISATIAADDVYLSATGSYTLQVIQIGSAPLISIEQSDGYSVQIGDTVDLQGSAEDPEDGSLPTTAQLDESAVTGNPITSLKWESNLDGLLGYGSTLDIDTMSEGEHIVSYSATDSDGNTGTAAIRVLVGNIAPLAATSASSTYCSSPTDSLNCYFPERVNDTSLSNALGGNDSWVNNNISSTLLPQWVELSWPTEVTIHNVDVYSTTGYIIRDYDIEYFDGTKWVAVVSVIDNIDVTRKHKIATIVTDRLRVLAKEGSLIQPQHARVNEIVVFGTAPLFSPATF